MALPSKPTEHETPAPTPKTTPNDSGNAADKPWFERPGHAGAAVTPAERAPTERKVKEDQ